MSYLYIFSKNTITPSTCPSTTIPLNISKCLKDKEIDAIDLNDLRIQDLKKYNVILVDYFIFFRYKNYLRFKSLFGSIQNVHECKKLLFVRDCHDYTFFPYLNLENKKKLVERYFKSESIEDIAFNYSLLKRFIKKFKFDHIIFSYDNVESKFIKSYLNIRTSIVPLSLDTDVFKDYLMPKIYDIIFYGTTLKDIYPFRYRLYNILKAAENRFRILFVDSQQKIQFEALSRLINQSWIGITTKSKTNYFLEKYLEIPGSKCVIAGNVPETSRNIFGDNFIELSETMTDDEIIKKLEFYLGDKSLLLDMSEKMYSKVHSEFNYEKLAEKLLVILKDP